MSHGADGGPHGGGAGFDHGFDHSSGSMHGLGQHLDHHGFDRGFEHGLLSHTALGGSAMFAALHGSSSAQAHYGNHTVVLAFGMGLISGGHVISLINNGHAVNYGHAYRSDGPGGGGSYRDKVQRYRRQVVEAFRATKQNPRDLRIGDIKGARLLLAHALGLKDHGSGYYGPLLDRVAKRVGAMRIDSRPNLKGMDENGLDGILPWNAWGDPRSTVGPDSFLTQLNGKTDRIIHIFAIPKRMKVNGKWKLAVSPDEVVTMPVRLTIWHNAETRDVEVKVEVIVQSCYVWDPFQNGQYTFYGSRTVAIEVMALELIKELFAELTAEGELADPSYRIRYAELVNRLPHMKGRVGVDNQGHPIGVNVGTAADQAELDQEAIDRDRREDRDSENQVAGQTQAPAVSDPDDGTTMNGPEGSPVAVVVGPPVIPPAPTPAPGPVTGKFEIPIDLK